MSDAAQIPAPDLKAQELQRAFDVFNQVSLELTQAYEGLQARVESLTAELAVANGELRRQYQEKEALSERLSLLLNALPAGVVVLDSAARISETNPAARAMLGEAIIGCDWPALAQTKLAASDAPDEWQLGAQRVSIAESPLDSAGGRILLLHDITVAHGLKADLERNQRLAAMGEMAASLAHQLRTPLSTAMLYASNLKKTDLKEEDRQKFIDKILTRLKALEGLIQNMLGFVRGQVSECEPLDLAGVLEDLGAVFLPQCQARGIDFVCSAGPESAITVKGDRKALIGAMTNLLENAMYFSPTGSCVELSVAARGNTVCLAVSDSGPGIPDAEMGRLFEPFYTTRSGGTGLGLAIVKKVAEELGGEVACSNRPQGGARFEFCLPVQQHTKAVSTEKTQ